MLNREAAPLRAQLLSHIREGIVSGRYLPGHRLIEKNLEAEYGVSRTVVRETLRQLESEQLVETVPNIGPRVRGLTLDDIVDLYQVREALESTACRLAAETASAEDLVKVRSIYDRLTRQATSLETSQLIAEKNRFYGAVIQASGNPIIGEMLKNVQARVSQLRFLTLGSPHRIPQMIAELGRVMEAMEARDSAGAEAAARAHVASAAEIAIARSSLPKVTEAARDMGDRAAS